MKFIFGIQINMKVFYKLILSFLVCVSEHVQSTQNNKLAISLRYLKKDVSDEVDLLHADKHKGLLQIDTMILVEIVRHSQNSQNSKFSMSLQYLKKKVRDEVDFWINFKVSCKLISALWPSTFPRKWYYHWYSWSRIFKVLKMKTLHYLYNITKNKLGVKFIFSIQINIKISTSWHYLFYGSGQTCPKYPTEVGNIFAIY